MRRGDFTVRGVLDLVVYADVSIDHEKADAIVMFPWPPVLWHRPDWILDTELVRNGKLACNCVPVSYCDEVLDV